jgi:hypothetical protein
MVSPLAGTSQQKLSSGNQFGCKVSLLLEIRLTDTGRLSFTDHPFAYQVSLLHKSVMGLKA